MHISSVSWRTVLGHLRKAAVCALLYAIVLAGGVFGLLAVSSSIGYLPYSDRPGPGWFRPHLPTLQELGLYASWTFFFVAPFALLWGAILFVFAQLISWLGAPVWTLRILGGFLAAALGLLGIEAAGWYIAISTVAVCGGAVLGFVYGAVLLPKLAAVRSKSQHTRWDWVGIAAVTALLMTGIVYPLIPDRDAQSLEVCVVRLVPGPEELAADSTGLTATEASVLRSLGLRGELHGGGVQSISEGGDKQARALIIVRGQLSSKVRLREPNAANVIFVQEGDAWNMYPSDAPTLRKTITLTNAAGEFEGLSVAIEPGEPTLFKWYPPIRRRTH